MLAHTCAQRVEQPRGHPHTEGSMGDPPERRARAQIRAVATLAIMDSEEVNGGWSVAGKPQKKLV